jgi:hypothetical protein
MADDFEDSQKRIAAAAARSAEFQNAVRRWNMENQIKYLPGILGQGKATADFYTNQPRTMFVSDRFQPQGVQEYRGGDAADLADIDWSAVSDEVVPPPPPPPPPPPLASTTMTPAEYAQLLSGGDSVRRPVMIEDDSLDVRNVVDPTTMYNPITSIDDDDASMVNATDPRTMYNPITSIDDDDSVGMTPADFLQFMTRQYELEEQLGNNPALADADMRNLVTNPALADTDLRNLVTNPALADADMRNLVTNPSLADTDLRNLVTNPALADADLRNLVTNPALADADLRNLVTNPALADVDMRNLVTNPSLADTDMRNLVTNPALADTDMRNLVSSPALADTDMRNLVTNPMLADTDMRNLVTNPALADADMRSLVTNPALADTDMRTLGPPSLESVFERDPVYSAALAGNLAMSGMPMMNLAGGAGGGVGGGVGGGSAGREGIVEGVERWLNNSPEGTAIYGILPMGLQNALADAGFPVRELDDFIRLMQGDTVETMTMKENQLFVENERFREGQVQEVTFTPELISQLLQRPKLMKMLPEDDLYKLVKAYPLVGEKYPEIAIKIYETRKALERQQQDEPDEDDPYGDPETGRFADNEIG